MSKEKKTSKYRENLIERSEEAKTVRKIVTIIIVSLVLILFIGGISGYMYIKSALNPVDPSSEEEIVINIPMGSSTSAIANLLEENGVIKDSRIFRFYIKFKNESDFQAGEYTFTPAIKMDEITEALKSGKVIEDPIYTITIPEGKTVDQIADIYSSKLSFSKEDFLKKMKDPKYIGKLIDQWPNLLSEVVLDTEILSPLEGYLFAATYDFYDDDPTVETVIEKMLDKTEEVVSPFLADIGTKDLTVHEALTLASIVERESKFPEDRSKVAQVFLNRLDNNMKLQSDITAAYANGEHKIVMTYDDIEVESPYNTYVVDKLPIGPISSPSMESIEAVAHPEGDEFTAIYFYARPSGETLYSSTLDEHNKIKQQYEEEWHELNEK